jgi:hypothetical protein
MDYDQQAHKIRAASVSGGVYTSFGFAGLTYYNTRNLPPTQFASKPDPRDAGVRKLSAGGECGFQFQLRLHCPPAPI